MNPQLDVFGADPRFDPSDERERQRIELDEILANLEEHRKQWLDEAREFAAQLYDRRRAAFDDEAYIAADDIREWFLEKYPIVAGEIDLRFLGALWKKGGWRHAGTMRSRNPNSHLNWTSQWEK